MRSYKIVALGMLGGFLGMVLFSGISWFYQDVFTVDRNGTVDFRISTAGNVGIGSGSDNPQSRLVVKGSGTGTTTSALDVQASNGTSRMFVRDDGNVGIGTTGPSSLLEVTGEARVSGVANRWRAINGGGGSDGWLRSHPSINGLEVGTLSNSDLFFITNASEKMRILASGNVGIGTTSPATSAKLEIAGTDGALLIPRMTTAQRDALTAANGMIIYNTSTNAFNFRENGAWVTK